MARAPHRTSVQFTSTPFTKDSTSFGQLAVCDPLIDDLEEIRIGREHGQERVADDLSWPA